MASSAAEIIQSAGGQIQVIQATPEQVAQLQQAHQIQILQGDATQVIGVRLFKLKLFLCLVLFSHSVTHRPEKLVYNDTRIGQKCKRRHLYHFKNCLEMTQH